MFTVIDRRNKWYSINVGNITFIEKTIWEVRTQARMQTLPLTQAQVERNRQARKALIFSKQDRNFDR